MLDSTQSLPLKKRFPRQARLLNGRAYSRVFKNVQFKTGNRHLLMLATHSSLGDDARTRLGIIIAKRHVKHATKRNRLKRVIRESFRYRQAHLPDIDVIVLARPGVALLDNDKLYQQLDRLWTQLSHQVDSASN